MMSKMSPFVNSCRHVPVCITQSYLLSVDFSKNYENIASNSNFYFREIIVLTRPGPLKYTSAEVITKLSDQKLKIKKYALLWKNMCVNVLQRKNRRNVEKVKENYQFLQFLFGKISQNFTYLRVWCICIKGCPIYSRKTLLWQWYHKKNNIISFVK